ncbi:MAG: hypothetical protein AB1405_05020 [Bdellovibrionota bacterium]
MGSYCVMPKHLGLISAIWLLPDWSATVMEHIPLNGSIRGQDLSRSIPCSSSGMAGLNRRVRTVFSLNAVSTPCPSCGLFNPPSARVCDCGYVLSEGPLTDEDLGLIACNRKEAVSRRKKRWKTFFRRAVYVLVPIALIVALKSLPKSPLAAQEAEEIAASELERLAEKNSWNISRLGSPRIEGRQDNYRVIWNYVEPDGEVELTIYVGHDRWPEFRHEGYIGLLKRK